MLHQSLNVAKVFPGFGEGHRLIFKTMRGIERVAFDGQIAGDPVELDFEEHDDLGFVAVADQGVERAWWDPTRLRWFDSTPTVVAFAN